MKTVLYPGSFDPVTNGHFDVIKRAASLFDRLVVAAAVNGEKSPMFTFDERVQLLKEVCKDLPNVEIVSFQGLLVNALAKFDACAVIRGLRAVSDFEYEFQMALMNRELSALWTVTGPSSRRTPPHLPWDSSPRVVTPWPTYMPEIGTRTIRASWRANGWKPT